MEPEIVEVPNENEIEAAQDTEAENEAEVESTPESEGAIKQKTHFTGTVTKIGLAGALVDIGVDKPGVMHISQIIAPIAAEDKSRREFIDAKNQADSLAYQVEKTVNEHREKLPAGDLSRVEAAIAEVRKRAEGDDLGALKKAIDDLQHASHAIAQALYAKQTGATGPTGSSGSTGSSGGGANVKDAEVVDAEYAETA